MVALNRAIAISMVVGPERGLELVRALEGERGLAGYPLLRAARADLLRRAQRWQEAEHAYEGALEVAGNEGDRAVLTRRLREVREAR